MNEIRITDALADYLDHIALGKMCCRSVFDLRTQGPAGVETLERLATYVRSLAVDDPRMQALAAAHRYLTADGPHQVFVPRTPAGRAMIDGVGVIRTGTATEFVEGFVAVETTHLTLHAA